MLQREAIALAKIIFKEPARLRLSNVNPLHSQTSFVRSMAAVTKSSKSTKQIWRKTRKKVGPSTSTAVIEDAEKDVNDALNDALRDGKVAMSAADDELFESSWVPLAYRGIGDETEKGKHAKTTGRRRLTEIRTPGMVRPRRVSAPVASRYILHSKDGEIVVPVLVLPQEAMIAKRKKEANVIHDVRTLMKVATSYRRHLLGDDAADDTENGGEPPMLTSSTSIRKQIASVLRSIHDGVPTNREQIQNSVADFKLLCQLLQQICSTACHLSTLRKFNDQDASTYIDLAVFTLLELVKINDDRSILLRGGRKGVNDSGKSKYEESQLNSKKSMTSWFNEIVEGLTPDLLSTKPIQHKETIEKTHIPVVNMAIDDAILQSIKRLLKNVMASLASTMEKPLIPLVSQSRSTGNSEKNGAQSADDECSRCEKVVQRMTALVDATLPFGVCNAEIINSVMELLARYGNLKNARLCYDIYNKYIVTYRRLSFAIVLEAYLEAIKRETNQEARHSMVVEVMNIQTSRSMSTASHRVERILQVSIVLSILAEADMGKVDGICGSSELMVRRALGGKEFLTFLEEVESETPYSQNLLLSIANYLAQLFATSGQTELETIAKKLLKYAMTDSDGANAMTTYPTTEACNAVLKTLVHSENGEDYAFARNVLQVMFSRAEMGCCPNQTTYDCLFDQLEAVNPRDIGRIGEELLSYIETSCLFYVSSTFTLPFSTYHRVLQYYLRMAKDTNSSLVPAVHEQNLPYRRAAHILRQLEIRSTPLVLHDAVLKETTVENLYVAQLRPNLTTYRLVMQICANTSQIDYQQDAADVAIEIYRTRSQHDKNDELSWDAILESCTNEMLIQCVKELTDQKM